MKNLTTKTALIEYLIEQVTAKKSEVEFTQSQPYHQLTDILVEDKKAEIRQLIEFIEFVGNNK